MVVQAQKLILLSRSSSSEILLPDILLKVDKKAKHRNRAFGCAMRQENLSEGRRIDLIEFFGCQCSFQARVRGMLNQCHEKDSLATSSLSFPVLMWYTAANVP